MPVPSLENKCGKSLYENIYLLFYAPDPFSAFCPHRLTPAPSRPSAHQSQSSAHATKRLGAMQRAARGTGPTARLAAPLAEHERERAERLVEYERAQEEVGKWQPIVKRNREAEQLRCAKRERER